jgi:hypothetical protein
MIKQRSLVKLIVLSILTCGIYGFFFWWGYINDINNACVCDGKKSPNFLIVIVLSSLTCGLYYLIWLYRQGERLKFMAPAYGLNFKEGGGTVLIYHLLGSFMLSIGSSFSSLAAMASGRYAVTIAGVDDAALRDAVAMLNIAPDAALLLLFCGAVLYLVSITLSLSAIGILIRNLNAVGRVYNSRIFNSW